MPLRSKRHYKALIRHLSNALAVGVGLYDACRTINCPTVLLSLSWHVSEDIFNLCILHLYLALKRLEIVQKRLILLYLNCQALDHFSPLLISAFELRMLDRVLEGLYLALKNFNVFWNGLFEKYR